MGYQHELPFDHADLHGCENEMCAGHSRCTVCHTEITERRLYPKLSNAPTTLQVEALDALRTVIEVDPMGMCRTCGSHDICRFCLRQYMCSLVDHATYYIEEQ